MKTLLLITNGFPYGDSEQSFLSIEFRELCNHFRVILLAICPKSTEITHDIPSNVIVYRLEKEYDNVGLASLLVGMIRKNARNEITKYIKRQLLSENKSLYKLLKIPFTISRYNERAIKFECFLEKIDAKHEIDCFYTFWCTPATLASVRYARRHGGRKKVVTRFHRYDLFNEEVSGGMQLFRDEISEGCNKLIFISEQGRDYYSDHWLVDDSKLVTSYLGSADFSKSIDLMQRKEDMLCIVSCASLIKRKRVDIIAEAIAKLDNRYVIEWHHYGEGSEKTNIIDRCKELFSSKKNVKWFFHGYTEPNKLAAEYQKVGAQIFVSTSLSEGLPISVLEAESLEMPIIAINVGGMSECVENEVNGYLLPENATSTEVAKAIKKYYDLPLDRKHQMMRNSRDIWERKFDASTNAYLFSLEILKEI